jgi:DNA-binding transcriptional LysR family regulator
LELRHLRYFVAVAERLNFRRAAEALSTSQPSLSLQIRALEDELHVRLFERTRRKVELTPAGRFYLHEVRRIFGALQLANEQVVHVDPDARTEIVVGSARGTIVRYIPGLLTAVRAAHPAVALKIRSVHPVELLGQLRDRIVQLGFVHGPVHDPVLIAEPLWEHGFCVVLPANHVAGAQEIVDLRQLHGERLIQYASTSSQPIHDEIAAICLEREFAPTDVEEAPATSRVIGSVASGDGFAIVPDHWRLIGTPGVIFRPLAPHCAHRLRISACWHRDETAPLVHDFVRIARARDGSGLHALNPIQLVASAC